MAMAMAMAMVHGSVGFGLYSSDFHSCLWCGGGALQTWRSSRPGPANEPCLSHHCVRRVSEGRCCNLSDPFLTQPNNSIQYGQTLSLLLLIVCRMLPSSNVRSCNNSLVAKLW